MAEAIFFILPLKKDALGFPQGLGKTSPINERSELVGLLQIIQTLSEFYI